MSIEILKKELDSNIIKKVYLFYGEEDYLKRHYTQMIEKKVLNGQFDDMNKSVREGKSDFSFLEDAIEVMPFFSDKRLIILKNTGWFKSAKKDEEVNTKTNKNDALITIIASIPDFITVIFVESEIDGKKKKLLEEVKSEGLVVNFELQKPANLSKWASKIASSMSVVLRPNISEFLIEYCEPSMDVIKTELDKLILFVGKDKEITKQDIEKICTRSIKSRVFDLVDVISDKKSDKAIKTFHDMLELREASQKIFFLIAKQIRTLYNTKLLIKEGKTSAQICGVLGVQGFIVSKLMKQVSGFENNKLKEALEEVVELEYGIKSGQINDITAIELIIAKYS